MSPLRDDHVTVANSGTPAISLDDDTLVVAIRFEVVHRVSEAERAIYPQTDQ